MRTPERAGKRPVRIPAVPGVVPLDTEGASVKRSARCAKTASPGKLGPGPALEEVVAAVGVDGDQDYGAGAFRSARAGAR